ncbi:succinate dehydrogenase, cytochrome b556 subunit, partial [Candidatus Liberibacter asiaticus]
MSSIKNNRPLSPHLQIYRLIPTMFVSIVHRITGSVVYLGTPVVVFWFFCIANGEHTLSSLRCYMDGSVFEVCLFLYTWAVIH